MPTGGCLCDRLRGLPGGLCRRYVKNGKTTCEGAQGTRKERSREKSAVAEHVLETTHAIHWQAKVISKEQHMTRRKVIEALAIQRIGRKAGTLMNLDKGVELINIWLNLDQ